MKVIVDDGYRIARFLQILRAHGMRNVHEARITGVYSPKVLREVPGRPAHA